MREWDFGPICFAYRSINLRLERFSLLAYCVEVKYSHWNKNPTLENKMTQIDLLVQQLMKQCGFENDNKVAEFADRLSTEVILWCADKARAVPADIETADKVYRAVLASAGLEEK